MKKALILIASFLFALAGCSRESDIRVNGSLRNNHSVVFAFTERPDSVESFVDSISALDSVYTFDTLTVTVHDSIYLMGFLKYNANKVLRYAWKTGDRDSLLSGANGEIFSYAYDSVGIFSPLFIAVDGANARDTAGRGQFIRVIDTPPDISVPEDTLWTRGERDADVKFFATDSFGNIDSAFVIPLDAKNSALEIVKAVPSADSGIFTAKVKFKNVQAHLNAKNEIRYVYGARDEDGNVSTDTAVLHFNRIPTIELLQPDSASRKSIYVSRFAFYYAGSDDDNPTDLRYSIRVGKSPDNSGTAPVLTDANLVASNIKEKSWEAIADSVWNMDESLRGRLYWQVSVTDGFDTATSPTWNFFFGDLNATTGTLYGYAKFQGRTAHNGIQIVMENLENKNYTFSHTNEKGYFSAKVDPGIYRIYARDTTGFGYKHLILDSQYVEMGDERLVATMLLQDTMAPRIRVDDYDSVLTVRNVRFAGSLSDSGSQIAKAVAWFDGKEVPLSVLKVNEWGMNFDDLTDGAHDFRFVVLDSAKNVSDTAKIRFRVKASSIELKVNGQATSMISEDGEFRFEAVVGNVKPLPDSVSWICTIAGKQYELPPTEVEGDSVARAVLSAADVKNEGAVPGNLYTMRAAVLGGTVMDSVRFGFLGENPNVYFLTPKRDTAVSLNDSLFFSVESFPGAGAEIRSIAWKCDATLSDGYACPGVSADSATLAWKSVGTKKILVTLTDSENRTAKDSITVRVVSDPPSVSIKADADTIRQKINASLKFSVVASDKFGTVNALEWGCGTNAAKISFDSSALIQPGKNVSAEIHVTLPKEETNAYKCIVRATDDDGERGFDTLHFRAVLDRPSITLFTASADVKIKSKVRFAGSAVDTLGTIVGYEMFCGTSVGNPSWIPISKPDTTLTMPSTACKWYCVMRVTDDDALTAMDTAVYNVLLDPPTVRVSEDTLTVSIKDTVTLDAMASDKLGSIVLYEWSCGNSGVAGNRFVSSTSTPRYTAVMPSSPVNGYLCIVRVTDDDGNTASDTTKISVLLDPPTVKVSKSSVTARPGFPLNLNATATDWLGYIAKREWSCGAPSEIVGNWKKVSDYDTTWTTPKNPSAIYYCVARATDDDGNMASDTVRVSFTTEVPLITVDNDLIYVLPGTSTELTARVNKAWQGIKRYTWTCGAKGSAALSDTSSKNGNHVWWNVGENYSSADFYFWDTDAKGKADSTVARLSREFDEFQCVVFAEETGTNFVATDTTVIRRMASLPVGVIDMPDTVYLWSLDSSVSDFAKYWYMPDMGGGNSKLGTLGDRKAQAFYWNFSNVSADYWYAGNSDGTLDTNIAEFNTAFLRRSTEGSITVKLNYFDSSKVGMDQNFVARHEADVVSKKVYFRKAWNNISNAKDSILESSTDANGPAIAYCKDRLIAAYVKENGSVATKYRAGNGASWTAFGNPGMSDVLAQTLYLACDGNDNLYLSFIGASDKKGHVFKSAGSTGTWTELGSGIGSNLSMLKLAINPKTNNPSVAWIGTVGSQSDVARVQDYSSSWGSAFNPLRSSGWQNREIDMAFDDSGNRLVVVTGHETNDYYIYYYYIPSGRTQTSNSGDYKIGINAESVQAFYSNGYFYVGFRSRDDDGLPRLARASANGVKSNGAFTTTGKEFEAFGHRCFNTFFAVDGNGNPILAIDDAYYARNSHVHVYRYTNRWLELGENELPYFKNLFAAANSYYVRGFRPQLVVSPSGKIFLSMRAQEAASSSASNLPGTKNGPLVMEFLGDNW